ncbi:hypothetical protein ArsFIN_32510 [Arsenophonus nasoniae]|uniref:Uncharacterized protein n=1 Tax=Arsenophonus nasoniae TaxID=638 RepID=A0A4P7KWN5_9GAMM|nr:hypothetical protein ArsFIN_32510 [Arsenophonus nasoniae]
MRMLIELATVSMQRTKNANFEALALGVFEHGAGCTAKELVEQVPVIVKKRPK